MRRTGGKRPVNMQKLRHLPRKGGGARGGARGLYFNVDTL
nr:MAG TPA: hypothetical protein [Caudoviricetes sp.]